ncbi:aldehyde dehydrogenase family protein [Flavobacterium psychrotrophum]|uniref:aldehyde dehydrogenase family protein n=1 Tax=Flavobacterium psychrotrophum TaxID=2294119 RepID=UPI001F099431|nr:aldehyde dehydrogenase family protein [Flavobacterium psychrotrophum]
MGGKGPDRVFPDTSQGQADYLSEKQPLVIGSYPIGTTKEAGLALDAALKAFDSGKGEWPSMSMKERIECLENFTIRMISKRDAVIKLIMWEIAKTLTDAEKEFDRTVDYIKETIKAAQKLQTETSAFTLEQNFIGQTKKVPYGVVLCMGPFNYPLNETFTTLIPALIMGNVIMFKPPKQGTLLFEPLLDAFQKAFPKGVINTVYGRGRDIIPGLMQSGKVDVLALIGSSKVADSLKKMHPKSNRLKSVLGLDAKNAAIIMSDADLDLTVSEAVAGALAFNGQRCTALKIFFVHKDIREEFIRRLRQEVNKLVIGLPWVKGVNITPLAEPDKPAYLLECIQDAIKHGATVINAQDGGGENYESFLKPAIVFPVTKAMKLYHEEQFGPVLPIIEFTDIATPIDYVTNSPYGQQVSIFSNDTQAISTLIDGLTGQVGRININSQCQRGPDIFAFNGRKDSAEGTLSVDQALLAFSVDSVIAAKQTQQNGTLLNSIVDNHSSSRLESAQNF